MSIKDKRVDKMLSAHNLIDVDIFYSSISIWLLSVIIICSIAHWLIFYLAYSKYYPVIIIYFALGYFISAYLNNSFALTQDSLIVINPNFPFKNIKIYPLTNISTITIDKTNWIWHFIFCVFGSNYIKIQTKEKSKKYFCVGLELDSFDENWTEKTLDTFYHKLEEKGVPTIFNFK